MKLRYRRGVQCGRGEELQHGKLAPMAGPVAVASDPIPYVLEPRGGAGESDAAGVVEPELLLHLPQQLPEERVVEVDRRDCVPFAPDVHSQVSLRGRPALWLLPQKRGLRAGIPAEAAGEEEDPVAELCRRPRGLREAARLQEGAGGAVPVKAEVVFVPASEEAAPHSSEAPPQSESFVPLHT